MRSRATVLVAPLPRNIIGVWMCRGALDFQSYLQSCGNYTSFTLLESLVMRRDGILSGAGSDAWSTQ